MTPECSILDHQNDLPVHNEDRFIPFRSPEINPHPCYGWRGALRSAVLHLHNKSFTCGHLQDILYAVAGANLMLVRLLLAKFDLAQSVGAQFCTTMPEIARDRGIGGAAI